MRQYFPLILSALLLPACTMQQENGNTATFAPPLIAGNHWRITQQTKAQNGDRVCIVSAGEMEITQRAQGKAITLQVATSSPVNPGDHYRVIYDNDVHETPSGESTFNPPESKAIIADLMKGGIVYTEIQERVIHEWGGGEFRRGNNKIDLSGFAEPYKDCKQFVTAKR